MKVGDIVVLGSMVKDRFYPIQHNSRNFPEHPCRGKVTKITKTFVFVSSCGTDWRVRNVPMEGYRHDVVLSVEEAKQRYRAGLQLSRRETKTIDELVNSL